MKAILVIDDMPKDCYSCDFCLGGSSLMYLCERTGKEFEFINGERKDFCPLKPMPQEKDDLRYLHSYTMGYNDCLKEILGEQE